MKINAYINTWRLLWVDNWANIGLVTQISVHVLTRWLTWTLLTIRGVPFQRSMPGEYLIKWPLMARGFGDGIFHMSYDGGHWVTLQTNKTYKLGKRVQHNLIRTLFCWECTTFERGSLGKVIQIINKTKLIKTRYISDI